MIRILLLYLSYLSWKQEVFHHEASTVKLLFSQIRCCKVRVRSMRKQAADLRDAVKKLDEGMKGTMADYQIALVSETPLMDVFPYIVPDEDGATDKTGKNADSPVIRSFLCSLPDGCRTSFNIDGKSIIIDKTGKGTVVSREDSDSKH